MGYNRELPPKHPSCGNPGVTPLPVPYCPHFGSREPCHLYGKLDGNSNFFSQNHEEDKKDTPSRQPRPPPEDRPISTYPASQKKTAISRQRPKREQQQQQNKKKRKGEQQHINARPSHRYGMIRTAAASTYTELAQTPNGSSTQPCSDVQERCVVSCLLYTSPSPRDRQKSRMPSSA